jgi:hypothetical protein
MYLSEPNPYQRDQGRPIARRGWAMALGLDFLGPKTFFFWTLYLIPLRLILYPYISLKMSYLPFCYLISRHPKFTLQNLSEKFNTQIKVFMYNSIIGSE